MSDNGGVALIGHLGRGEPRLDGQTLRTRLVLAELGKRAIGPVRSVDTAWLSRRPIRVLLGVVSVFRNSDIVLIMPGVRGLKILLPIFLWLASLFGRSVHYLVVGGWLPDFLRKHTKFVGRLRRIDGVYVQSQRMLTELEKQGLSNVHYLSNFKDFAKGRGQVNSQEGSLSLVFLSRIIPEKGVEHSIEAIRVLNEGVDEPLVRLELWGTVPSKYEAWFAELLERRAPGVSYRGELQQESVIDQLGTYDAMLFPTWYEGEGFPGAVIDAYAAGIPVVASDWHDNAEFITHLETGVIFETGSVEQLVASVRLLLDQPELLRKLKLAASSEAARYHVDAVIPPLFRQLGIDQKPG